MWTRSLFIVCVLAVLPLRAASDPASRIVVLGGDLTEIVYALGAEDRLAGVDSTSVYPEAAKDLPQVGYVRRLAPEGLLSLSPDLIIASHDAGPPSALDKVKAAGVVIATAPQGDSFEGILAKIAFVGGTIGLEEDAARLQASVRDDMEAARAGVDGIGRSAVILMSGRSDAVMAAGEETSASAILNLAGATNAMQGFTGYKPVGLEALIAAAPEAIVLPSHTVDALGGVDAILEKPGIAATPAGRDKRVVVVDSMLLLGFGPRTPEAVRLLAEGLAR